MSRGKEIEVFVGGLAIDPSNRAPIVVLRDAKDRQHIPIWIGMPEATSIAAVLRGIPLTRPLTHDLMCEALVAVGAKVQRVTITELREATYYAEVVLLKGEEIIVLDARPSDAIAIALRACAPIYITQDVIDEVNELAREVVKEQKGDIESETLDEEINSSIIDANSGGIDKKRWNDLLEKLDPKDFKFKV